MVAITHAFRALRDDWIAYAHRVAHFQLSILLSLMYVTVVGALWVGARIARRGFLPYRDERTSTWLPRRVDPRSLTDLDRPF